jgi:hypothetical protein
MSGPGTGVSSSDPKRHDRRLAAGLFQYIAGFPQQVRNIDTGERIGARHDQNVTGLHGGERFAGAQHRERAFEAAQVEGLFCHQ